MRRFLISLYFLFCFGVPSLGSAASAPSLSVRISGSDAGVSAPRGSQSVPLAIASFTASCDASVSIRSITVTHVGMGDRRDVTAVYALMDGRRKSRVAPFSDAGHATLRFLSPLIVPACGSVRLSLSATFSISAAVGGEHRLMFVGPGDIDAPGVSISLVQDSSTAVRTLSSSVGQLSVEVLPPLVRVSYGDHRSVARLRLTVDPSSDQLLHAITLTNDGSARDADLLHLSLERVTGERVTDVLPSLDGRQARLTLSPSLRLARGSVVLLEVTADVRVGYRRNIRLILDEPADVETTTVRGR